MGSSGSGFAIMQVACPVIPSAGTTDFFVDDIEALWVAVRTRAPVIRPLEKTPSDSYKFIISDPDGNQLGFVQRD